MMKCRLRTRLNCRISKPRFAGVLFGKGLPRRKYVPPFRSEKLTRIHTGGHNALFPIAARELSWEDKILLEQFNNGNNEEKAFITEIRTHRIGLDMKIVIGRGSFWRACPSRHAS